MQSSSTPNDPLSRFSLSIFRLNGFLMRNGDRITGSIGQSSARWQVLGRVEFEPQTVSQMARNMGHARQSVQRIADVLEKEGLITYRDNRSDKRTRICHITPLGKRVMRNIDAEYGEWFNHIKHELDIEQLDAASVTLEKIAASLEADENKIKEKI